MCIHVHRVLGECRCIQTSSMCRKGGSLMQQVKSILFPWKLYFLTQALKGFFYSLPRCYPLGYITHKNSPGEKWVFSPIYFLTSISQPFTSSVQAQWGKLKSLLLSGIKTGHFRWTKVVKKSSRHKAVLCPPWEHSPCQQQAWFQIQSRHLKIHVKPANISLPKPRIRRYSQKPLLSSPLPNIKRRQE